MPIESKSYLRDKHFLKFIVMLLLSFILLSGLFYLTSIFYNVNNKNSLLKSYNGHYSFYINEPIHFNKISKNILNSLEKNKTIDTDLDNIRNRSDYDIEQLILNAKKFKNIIINDDSIQKIKKTKKMLDDKYFDFFIEKAILFTLIMQSDSLLEKIIYKKRIVVTLSKNLPEVFTQIIMFIIGFILLVVFFHKKSDFLRLINSFDSLENKMLAIREFEILTDKYFMHRKKFHYFMAFIISLFFVLIHTAGIQEYSYSIGTLYADILDIVPYDYRINANTIILFLLYWLIQFSFIYFIILTGWEIKQLNLIQKIIMDSFSEQKKNTDKDLIIKPEKDIDKDLINKKYILYALLVSLFIGIVVASSFKFFQIPIDTLKLFEINKYFYGFYSFSPIIMISSFLLFIFIPQLSMTKINIGKIVIEISNSSSSTIQDILKLEINNNTKEDSQSE